MKKNNKIQMPPLIDLMLRANESSLINLDIAAQNKLTGKQLSSMTGIIGRVCEKEAKPANLSVLLKNELAVSPAVAKKIALEILTRRLLAADEIWFDGEIKKAIKELGANHTDYAETAKKYFDALVNERALEIDAEDARKKEAEAEPKEKIPLAITDPEEEKRSAKNVFGQFLRSLLALSDYELKLELNARLGLLLIQDNGELFQKELLDVMRQNKEKLTTAPIIHNNEESDPTIGNWLRDYIRYAGAEDVENTIKKAQYFTDSENAKKLDPKEKRRVDRLLDLYVNLEKFFINSTRQELEDILIFPLSPKEERAYQESLSEQKKEKSGDKENINEADIAKLYEDDPEDRRLISEETTKIINATRKDYLKVADIFEDYLLRRKKHGIIACLDILAEVGALDNVLAKDKRFQNLLIGYFKRNNLPGEEKQFLADPYQEKYIEYFLKYVFLERLGLAEGEGGRQAVKLSDIFRSIGLDKYSKLAYFDLKDNKFKWHNN
ncbi:MAG: hypothetical protein V1928_03540 [Parcubacteria group bacterium]